MDGGKPLNTPVDAAILVLAAEGRDGRLALCAGAGVSIPAGLPSGSELARRVHHRFQRVSGYHCAKPDDLLAVADAAARLPDGLVAVQRVVVELAGLCEAPPQLAHRLLALLLAEGALRLLLTNWDDCVERSWREFEHVQVARNETEAENLRGQFALKIHGCCTQAATLLITSEQLREAPLWTKSYFQAELARSAMVFVGIGDVADYAQKRITELAELVEHARVRVVSPDIATNWEGSEWQKLLPDLPEGRRIEKTAEDFLDELAREWVMSLVADLRGAPSDSPAPWVEAVADAFGRFTAVQALAWLRQAAVGWKVGESAVRAPAAASLLEAVGILARGAEFGGIADIRFLPASAVRIGHERLDVALYRERQTPREIEDAAAEQAQRVARRLGPRDGLHLLVAAGSVRGPKPREFGAVDVVDPDAPVDELVGGDRHVPVRLTYVDEVLEAA